MLEEKAHFFKRAQDSGIVQFIDKSGQSGEELPHELQRLSSAIRLVNSLPVLPQEDVEDLSYVDTIVAQLRSLHQREEALREERRMLRQETVRVGAFGDFNLKDIAFIEESGERKVQFFCAKKGMREAADEMPGIIYIGYDHGLDYFLSVQKESMQFDGMIEMRVDQPLGALQRRMLEVDREIYAIEDKIRPFAKYNTLFHKGLIAKLNSYNLSTSQEYIETLLGDHLFATEGWVATNKEYELQKLLSDGHIHCEQIAIEEDETIPTFLENEGAARVGEDLVQIYDTPSNTDKDPSLWVLWSFAIFFAIILADGGYGLLFLGTTLFFKRKFPNIKGAGRRFLKLSQMLSISCIIWGVLSTSFLGMSIAPDNPIRKVSIVHHLVKAKTAYHFNRRDAIYDEWVAQYPTLASIEDPQLVLETAKSDANGSVKYTMLNEFTDNVMLELALLIGVIHIALSFLRYLNRDIKAIGWVAFILGAYLYIPSYLKATSMVHYIFDIQKEIALEGQYLMIGGLSFVMLVALFKDKLKGLLEVSNLIQVSGDILSYLRLYALGLAGGIVSATVNDMAGSAGIVLGLIILLVGHSINIALSLMGGVIHGLRLNFIEWYHYSFEGGGKLFRPLKLMKID